MDLQIIKQNIKTNETALSEQRETAIDLEFTLPDYCPKIERIVKCTLTPRISNVSYTAAGVTADGEACISLLYTAADNMGLFGYETEVQFSKSIDCADCDRLMITAKARAEYVNCRAVNERKLDIHGAVMISFSGVGGEEVETVVGSDCDKLQLRRERMKAIELCGGASKRFVIDEELILPQMSDSIENIIRSDADIEITDLRTVADRAVVKGVLSVSMLYRSASGGCDTSSQTVPIEQIIDLDNAGEDCICRADAMICSLKLKPFTNAEGECRSVMMSAKVNIDVTACCEKEIEIVSDCYSITHDLDVERKNISLRTFSENLSAVHQLRETLTFPENSLCRVIDVSCKTTDPDCSFEDGAVRVKGSLVVSVIAEDSDSRCSLFEKTVEYSHDFNVSCPRDMTADFHAVASSCSYSIKSESSIEIRAGINISGTVAADKRVSVITDIAADDDRRKQVGEMPAVILYFAKAGESIWQIAMKYNTAADLIMQANDLAADVLSDARVLMIPGV